MLRYYFYLGLFVNSLCFFNLNAETIDQELQLAAAQCNVEEAQSLLDKGANPLASMTPESANSFDMVMTSMGMAAKSNNIELYQDCLRLAEIIRGEINSK
ncbi:MAG: hypothetical protein KDD50_11755, partial [Bdellovibrionales bacterium]|nr:hypothetical protein [Bdellovibrionales bacterium]